MDWCRVWSPVGDLLLHDVLGANLAGLQSIWLDADLPEHLLELPPIDRVHAEGPAFTKYLQKVLTTHLAIGSSTLKGKQIETCTPTAVVRDVDEAATVLLDRISAWTPASN